MLENIISGVIANCIFLLAIAFVSLIIWAIFYGKKLLDATHFFNVGLNSNVYVYVSAHADAETRTRKVITAEEFETVIEMHSILTNQFYSNRVYELVIAIFQLLQIAVRLPDFILKVSPLEELSTPQAEESLILVGGPTRNQISKYYLDNGNSWLIFDDIEKRFLINRGQRKGEELNPSETMAMVSKISLDHSVAFVVFGFGEIETRCALNYFVHNWRNLYSEFKNNDFAICLLITEERAEVYLKFSDI